MANIDLEMGQFQKVTTLENKDYIVVSLDNGTQGQIKVSDLASVVAAGVFQAKIKTVKCDIGGLVLDQQDNGFYYTTYYPPIEDNAIILNISVVTWSGNVFFLVQNYRTIVIKSTTSYTMPSTRSIQVTYMV